MLPRPDPAVILQRVSDGAILLDTRQEVYFGLDPVGAEIWELLGDAESLPDLCAVLRDRYPEVSADRLERDVRELLDALVAQNLAGPRDG